MGVSEGHRHRVHLLRRLGPSPAELRHEVLRLETLSPFSWCEVCDCASDNGGSQVRTLFPEGLDRRIFHPCTKFSRRHFVEHLIDVYSADRQR
jgi:hypothetical protein